MKGEGKAIALVSALVSFSAFATGPGSTGGGDGLAQEFKTIALQTLNKAKTAGPDVKMPVSYEEMEKLILSSVVESTSKPICVGASLAESIGEACIGKPEKDAINLALNGDVPGPGHLKLRHIIFNRARWMNKTQNQMYNIALHEFFGPQDSSYQLTAKLVLASTNEELLVVRRQLQGLASDAASLYGGPYCVMVGHFWGQVDLFNDSFYNLHQDAFANHGVDIKKFGQLLADIAFASADALSDPAGCDIARLNAKNIDQYKKVDCYIMNELIQADQMLGKAGIPRFTDNPIPVGWYPSECQNVNSIN